MNLIDIRGAAHAHLAARPDETVTVICNRIRKNLITLLAQSDIAELSGSVEAFGGDTDVAANIGSAVFGLFCLAERLSVDSAAAVSRYPALSGIGAVSPTATALSVAPPVQPAAAPAAEKAAPAPASSPPAVTAAAVESAPPETAVPAGKDARIAFYKKHFSEAKSRADADAVWRDVRDDKQLDGKDKFSLQADYKAACQQHAA